MMDTVVRFVQAVLTLSVGITLAKLSGDRGGGNYLFTLIAMVLLGAAAPYLIAMATMRRVAEPWGLAIGLATILFGASTSFWLSLAALAVMGAGDMVSVYIRHLLVQLATPDGIRGRVSAVNAVFIGASNELGEFESGLTAAWFGAVPAVLVGGCATLVVGAVWARLYPELWKVDRFETS